MKKFFPAAALIISSIILLSANILFSQVHEDNWTWYFYSTELGTDAVGSYLDVTIGLKADSDADVDGIGNFNIECGMSNSFYDFGELEWHDPKLVTNHLGANYSDMMVGDITGNYNWEVKVVSYSGGEGNGVTVTVDGIQVATVRLYIKNSSGTSNLQFNPGGFVDLTFHDDNTTYVNLTYDNTGGDVSLPVTITEISAKASHEDGVTIFWKTESESDCAGFNVLKSENEEGTYEKINTQVIPPRGDGATGAEYTFVDREVKDGIIYWYKIEEISIDGKSRIFGPISVKGINPIPSDFELSPNYPNPFNPQTTFNYRLPEACEVRIQIFSLLGRPIITLINQRQEAGYYTMTWAGIDENGEKVPSGIYFIRMQAGTFTKMHKMIVVR